VGYKLTDKCTGGIFSIPHFIHDSGQYAALSSAAQRLLCQLYRILNRTSTPWFLVSAAVLSGELHSDPKTIREARRELEQAGLVQCKNAASAGTPIEFHLVNPCTKAPFPLEEGCTVLKTYDPRKRRLSFGQDAAQPNAVSAVPASQVGEAEQFRVNTTIQSRRLTISARPTSLKLCGIVRNPGAPPVHLLAQYAFLHPRFAEFTAAQSFGKGRTVRSYAADVTQT
jgi:hypothetical protein